MSKKENHIYEIRSDDVRYSINVDNDYSLSSARFVLYAYFGRWRVYFDLYLITCINDLQSYPPESINPVFLTDTEDFLSGYPEYDHDRFWDMISKSESIFAIKRELANKVAEEAKDKGIGFRLRNKNEFVKNQCVNNKVEQLHQYIDEHFA